MDGIGWEKGMAYEIGLDWIRISDMAIWDGYTGKYDCVFPFFFLS